MRSIKIRFNDFENAKALHGYLRDTLGFEDYYGMNLDALYDVLSMWPEELKILTESGGTAFEEGFYAVFRDASEINRRISCREVKAGVSRRKRTRRH